MRTASIGSSANIGPVSHSAPTMIQLPSITPVAHDQRPVSRIPPSQETPRPVGASGAGARNGRV